MNYSYNQVTSDSTKFGSGGNEFFAHLSGVVKDGLAVADNGRAYTSVQRAENNASSWVFVGPGTFNESVTVDTAGLTLTGAGDGSEISGTSDLSVDASNVDIHNIKVTSPNIVIESTTTETKITSSTFNNIEIFGSNSIIFNTSAISGAYKLKGTSSNNIITNTICTDVSGGNGVDLAGDDNIYANSNINGTNVSASGIPLLISTADSLIGGNRIVGDGSDGVYVSGGSIDNIVYNNRISDGGFFDDGTGNVIDGNLTGASN